MTVEADQGLVGSAWRRYCRRGPTSWPPERPLRVAFVYGDYPPKLIGKEDGGADFVARLGDELALSGLEVSVIVSRRGDRSTPYETPEGVRVLPIIDDWSLSGALTGQLGTVRTALREAAADIVHLVYPDPYLRYGSDTYHLPFLLKAAGARQLVVTFFGFGISGASLVTKVGLFALFATADRIVITDADLLARFRRALWFWRSKSRPGFVGSISSAPSLTWSRLELRAWRALLGLDPDVRYVGFFGFWSPDKGLEDLLDAMRILLDGGEGAKLLLIGGRAAAERTDYEMGILSRIASLGLAGSSIITGPLSAEAVDHYLLASDVCVLPFRVNPLGRSSFALAVTLGVPTIVTRASVGAEIVEGVPQVEPRDAIGLARTIGELLNDDSVREAAASAARRVAPTWSWRTIGDSYRDLYSELTQSDPRGQS